jgi:hypothetical protein
MAQRGSTTSARAGEMRRTSGDVPWAPGVGPCQVVVIASLLDQSGMQLELELSRSAAAF